MGKLDKFPIDSWFSPGCLDWYKQTERYDKNVWPGIWEISKEHFAYESEMSPYKDLVNTCVYAMPDGEHAEYQWGGHNDPAVVDSAIFVHVRYANVCYRIVSDEIYKYVFTEARYPWPPSDEELRTEKPYGVFPLGTLAPVRMGITIEHMAKKHGYSYPTGFGPTG